LILLKEKKKKKDTSFQVYEIKVGYQVSSNYQEHQADRNNDQTQLTSFFLSRLLFTSWKVSGERSAICENHIQEDSWKHEITIKQFNIVSKIDA